MANKFRLKQLIVEAYQYLGTAESAEFLKHWSNSERFELSEHKGRIYAHTPDGVLVISAQDWLVKGADGHLYLRSPEKFNQTYEPSE
jgi:hypothetical protein